MKYIKYSIILVMVFAVFGVISAFASTYTYANITIPSFHQMWTSAQKQKQTEYKVQYFTNNGATDSLGNQYTISGRTQSMYDPVRFSSWKNASRYASASWGDENKRINQYRLQLKAQNYNVLSLSFFGSWTLD